MADVAVPRREAPLTCWVIAAGNPKTPMGLTTRFGIEYLGFTRRKKAEAFRRGLPALFPDGRPVEVLFLTFWEAVVAGFRDGQIQSFWLDPEADGQGGFNGDEFKAEDLPKAEER